MKYFSFNESWNSPHFQTTSFFMCSSISSLPVHCLMALSRSNDTLLNSTISISRRLDRSLLNSRAKNPSATKYQQNFSLSLHYISSYQTNWNFIHSTHILVVPLFCAVSHFIHSFFLSLFLSLSFCVLFFHSHHRNTVPTKELPWNEPTNGCKEYLAWKENKYTTITPWSKLDTLSLSYIRKILVPNPEKRLNMEKLKNHKWCSQSAATTTGKPHNAQCVCRDSLIFPVSCTWTLN